ncbi:MAG TPA: Ig-like domain-containing protein, partial [Polyangia bacterium]
NFPTGFPEGRIAWVAVHAYDLATGNELPIRDSFWKRSAVGVGNLTNREMIDPAFPGCNWALPAGSADPFSIQFKAVASLGNGCPTLDLPYATSLNLVTNERGLPIDETGKLVDAKNPRGLLQFKDVNGNGDLFDDAYLRDTRLKPMPNAGATMSIDRYAVEIPAGTVGPIAVSAAVYYQSVEAIVAGKFLGNMVDTNNNFELEPCVLGGLCDGRHPTTEPAVVEGSPPVPMVVRNWVIGVEGAAADSAPPRLATYPEAGARGVYTDAVVKVSFSEPVTGVDARTFTLVDAKGAAVPAAVDQIGAGTFGLFPHKIALTPGATYTAHLTAGIADTAGNRTADERTWSFTIAADPEHATGNTAVPAAFEIASQPVALTQPTTKRPAASAKGKHHAHRHL